jgi:CO/xanthine dehydrogenase Mo-binding subunit/aerobic-type carbon monoxide dehydrogenase small subunit (CoxS/CutS family)
MTHFTLNGSTVSVDLPDDTPLLWVVRDHLGLLGTKFGCGVGQCGACTVHVNGTAVRSCTRTLASVSGADIVTIEGLGNGSQHPLQKHWIKAQVPQCGYCQPGSIMQAASLLKKSPDPTDEEIVKSMNTVLCRCMTYDRIKAAIQGAAREMLQKDPEPASPAGGVDPVSFGPADRPSPGTGHRIETLWFDMDEAGIVTVNITKAEIGQHVGTALAQALAEELEVSWEDVRIRHVDSDPRWGLMITGGSWSVNWTFDQLGRAGAAGRIALIQAGARLLGAEPGQCRAEQSRVIDMASGKTIPYSEILARTPVPVTSDEEELKKLVLKNPDHYKLVSHYLEALDIPSKTDGSARYGIDVVRPGMLFGHPVTPPVRCGAKVLSIDAEAARKIPGFIKAVVLDDPNGDVMGFVVAVAATYPAAIKAAKALKVEWDLGPNQKVDSQALSLAAQAVAEHPVNAGNWVLDGEADKVIAGSERSLTARYTMGFNLHAPMEPMNATAEWVEGKWHLWAGCQNQTTALAHLARALAVDPSEIIIHQCYVGGGFGRRLEVDYLVVAALTAKDLGRPVKVIYSREQDFQFDMPRPPSLQILSGALDPEGHLQAVTHDVVSGSPTLRLLPAFLAKTADEVGKVDSFAVSGADFWYSVPNHHVRAIRDDLVQGVIPPGYWRGVGPGFTVFALESFMDEMADLAGEDPGGFRLRMLDGKGRQAGLAPNSVGGAARLARVLREVISRSGYDTKALPEHTAMGMACSFGQERAMPTWVACVAEVAADPGTGAFQVKKLTLVADLGTVVNPDGAIAQLQGGLLWGLSMATKDSSTVLNGAIAQKSLMGFNPLRMKDVPELEVHLLENHHYPAGAGEPATTVVAPAIANAIARAVGSRVRDLPITGEKVKTGMKL